MARRKTLILSAFLLLAILFISLTSAKVYEDNDIYYKERLVVTKYDNDKATTHTVYAYYNNDKRYSTYDYRHGYSYRTTKDYWEKQHDVKVYYEKNKEYKPTRVYGKNYRTCRLRTTPRRFYNGPDGYYIETSSFLREARVIGCYNHVPDKLFYTPCP
jgi:hypothetical protein